MKTYLCERGACTVHKIEYDMDTGVLAVGISGTPKMKRLRNALFALFKDAEYLRIIDTNRNRVIKRGPIRRMSEGPRIISAGAEAKLNRVAHVEGAFRASRTRYERLASCSIVDCRSLVGLRAEPMRCPQLSPLWEMRSSA